MAIDLKPCPFCGGAAHFDHDDDGWNWIECAGCCASTNARVSAMDDCKPMLAEQWNSRVTSGVLAGALTAPEYLAKIEADPAKSAALQRARDRAAIGVKGPEHG